MAFFFVYCAFLELSETVRVLHCHGNPMNPPPITLILRPPTVLLVEWTVFEVSLSSFGGAPTWHLVGMEVIGHATLPRISSPIIAVDNILRSCATRGGDIYHLKEECSSHPGDEIKQWAAWKKDFRIQSDSDVTNSINREFDRMDQQLQDYQPERPDDFPNDWFIGIPPSEHVNQYNITLDESELDERHQLCLRLAVQCAQLYRHELGNKANLRPFYFDTLTQEVLNDWDLSLKEQRWIAKQAREIELR